MLKPEERPPEKYSIVMCPMCGKNVSLLSHARQPATRLFTMTYMCSKVFNPDACGTTFQILWTHS